MKILSILTSLLSLIPVIIGFFTKRNPGKPLPGVFFYYLLMIAVFEIIGIALSLYSINNHFTYNLALLGMSVFNIYLAESTAISWMKLLYKAALVASVIFLLFDFFHFNKNLFILSSLCLGVVSIVHLLSLTKLTVHPFDSFEFWAFSGSSFFAFSGLFILTFLDQVVSGNNKLISQYYYILNFFVSLVVSVFYSIAYICLTRKQIF